MAADKIIERIIARRSPCIAGIDPEWSKLPDCYKTECSPQDSVLRWAADVIDCIADIVPAVKPQMAFFEVFGADGVRVFSQIVRYAHERDLTVIDDSKRSDIGNTARAYAFAHLAKDGPINADFMTVSPFLGSDSIQPFIDAAVQNEKGIFVLVKTSNPSSAEISEAVGQDGAKVSDRLARYVDAVGKAHIGARGYSPVGAVVGATFPEEAGRLRGLMPHSLFLVPGYGAQGGSAKDVTACFNDDGLGAVVSSSRGILYKHLDTPGFDGSRRMYLDIVRAQAETMRRDVCTNTACF